MTASGHVAATWVALLRGVNVGGKNRLAMKDLADVFVAAGCRRVRTYLQSGNVIYEARAGLAARLPPVVAAAIEERFGLRVPVVTRSATELASVLRHNPFVRAGEDPRRLHVMFLSDRPRRSRLADLDPDRSPPDRYQVRGREIYLCCPRGMARTKLSNDYFDRVLGTTGTVRSWSTVEKLAAKVAAKS